MVQLDKINWTQKLGSRKFWAGIAGLVATILGACGVGDSVVAQVSLIIGGFGALAVYILAEAYVDGKRSSGTGVPPEK
jgi:hypothetical protein